VDGYSNVLCDPRPALMGTPLVLLFAGILGELMFQNDHVLGWGLGLGGSTHRITVWCHYAVSIGLEWIDGSL